MDVPTEEPPLDEAETAVWRSFLRWSEAVTARVERDLLAATGLSAADYRILRSLLEAGEAMMQRTLQTNVGWTATRLSHQLRRMEERGYLVRSDTGVGRAVQIEITERARALLARGQAPHAASVRRNLLSRMTAEEQLMIVDRHAELAAGPALPPDGR